MPVPPPDNGSGYEGSGIGDICGDPGPSCQDLWLLCNDPVIASQDALEADFSPDFHKVPVGRVSVAYTFLGWFSDLVCSIDFVDASLSRIVPSLFSRLEFGFCGVCVYAGWLHASTEFMNGGSFEEWNQDAAKPLPWDLRVKLRHDTAKGLQYLHSKWVFHRVLTSKNILVNVVNQVPQAIVGDFGLADNIPDPLKRNMVRLPTVGSPWYMAPETLTGKWYDERADVFSFGIILCELIARIASDPDVLPRTQNFGVDYVAFSLMSGDCPPDFLQLTFKCCLVEPKSRPTFWELCTLLKELRRR